VYVSCRSSLSRLRRSSTDCGLWTDIIMFFIFFKSVLSI
jgi:hypothetical protein